MSRGTRSSISRVGSNKRSAGRDESQLPVLRRDYNFLKDSLHPDITFSRSSSATQRNSEGKICYAPHNLLIHSEAFDQWGNAAVATANTHPNPIDGTTTADTVGSNGGVKHRTISVTLPQADTYIFSIYLKRKTGTGAIRIGDFTDGTNEVAVTDQWQRFSRTSTLTAGAHTFTLRIDTTDDEVYAWGAQVERRLDGGTTPTDYNKTSGAAYNGPRLDWDHAASLSKDITESNRLGLLVEEQKTNLQPNSSLWVVATHAINNFNAIENNFAISPSGKRDAWRGECYDTGGAARHEFYTRYNKANATRYTHSLYIKPFGTVTHLKGSDEGSNGRGACFDLINCQVIEQSMSNEGATIEKITEDGWVRVSFTFVSVAANTDSYLYWAVGDEASLVDGSSIFDQYNPGKGQGIYVWGVQAEVQNLSSYIPTYGSTSVRSGDSAVVSGTNFSRFYKDGKGESWIVDAEDYEVQRTTSQQAAVIKVHEGGNTFLGFGKGFGGGVLNRPAVWYKDGVAGGDMIYNSNFGNQQQTIDKNASYKLGVALDVDDAAWIMNGHLLGAAQKDTSVPSLYSPTEVRLGTSASHEYNGHIRRVRYYNKRISDAKLVKETNTDFLLNKYQHVKAAHSLRQLKEENTNSPVTRIRREYDSYEADYTAAQVSNGELEADFQSSKQTTLPLDVTVEADEMITGGDFTDLIINGDFATDSDWTKATGWSIGSGVASCDGTQTSGTSLETAANIALVAGRQYTVTYTLTISAGSVDARLQGGTAVVGTARTSAGTYTETLKAVSGNNKLRIRGNDSFVGTVDNVSVVEGSWYIGSVWNISNAGISYDDTGGGNINTAVTLKKGRTYTVAFDVTSGTTPYIWLGNSAGSYSYDGRSYATRNIGHHTETFTMTSDQTTLAFYGSTSGTAFTIDNVSLKEVNPKATGYSCRKINSDYTGYAMRVRNNDNNIEAEVSFDENNEISLDSRVKATSMNLMPISENFAQVNMNASATVEAGQSDPFGGNNAYKLKATSTNYSGITPQITGITAGGYYTISAYMKAGTSTLSRIGIYDNNTNPFWINVDVAWSALGVPSTSASVGASNINYEAIGTDGWYRVSFTGKALATDGSQYFQIHADRNATAKNVLIYGIQLEETVYEDTPSGSELVTNGTFDTDGSTWGGDSSSGWYNITNPSFTSIVNGEAILDGSQGTSDARQHVDVTPGKTYQISVDMRTDSTSGSGSARFYMSDGENYSYAFGNFNATNTMTTYSKIVQPTQSKIRLYAYNTKDDKAYYDNISVKEISPLSPKDYTQTPVVSDAHNSTSVNNLRQFCGKENKLSYSEDFSQYSSDGNRLTVENLTGTTPIGNTYAKLTVNTDASAEKNLYLNQNFTIEAGETYVASVYVRNNSIIDSSDGENRAQLWLQRNGGGTYEGTGVTIPVSSEWQRISVSHTFAHNQTGLRAKVVGLTDADQGSIEVTGVQVNTNSLKDYQKTTGSPKTADCMVVVWYNQGGGEDATQDTASQQPRIVIGSDLVTDNGKPSIRFDGVDDNFKIEGEPTLKSAFWYANVLEQNSSNDQSYAQVLYGTGSWAYAAYFTTSTNISYYGWYLDNGWRQGDPDPVMGNGHVMSQINSGTRDVYFNGNQTLNHTTTTFTDGVGGMIGARDYGGGTHRNLDGNLSELLLYPSDMSNSRFQIEQNMTRHYDTNIVANGTFETTSKWTTSGDATINTSTNLANIDGTSQTSYIVQGVLKEGKTYILTFDVTSDNGTGNRWITNNLGGSGLYYNITGNGSKSVIFTHTNAHPNLFFTARNGGYFVVSNIKVQEYGTDGFINTLFDQSGNNCHATQATAANQPQIIKGGSLIKSGGHPAWDFVAGSPQRNLVIQGLTEIDPIDAFFVQEANDNQYIYPSSTSGSYYGWVALDGSSGVDVIRGSYGAPVLEVNGSAVSLSTEDDVHTALNGRKLVYHRSARTTSWPEVNIGNTFGTTHAWNLEDFKFSEMIWYDSDQHSNQSGIESNITNHYF